MRWFEQALEDLVGLAFALKDPDVGFLRYENLEQWPQKEFDIIEGGIGNSSFGFSQAIQTLRNMMHSKPEPVVIRDKDEPDERFLRSTAASCSTWMMKTRTLTGLTRK